MLGRDWAVTAEMYANLRIMLHAHVQSSSHPGYPTPLALALFDGLSRSNEDFKKLPGYEHRYAARSEYLFNLLQPELNELLKLGDEYERYFDRFEVLLGLEHAYLNSIRREGNYWGPPGMFAWKFHRMEAESPFHQLMAEAEAQGDTWSPINAGFFGGSFERFREVAFAYAEWINKLGWY